VERKDHATGTGMVFFLPGGRRGKAGSAVRGAKKHLSGKVPCQPGLLLDTVLSIFSVTYPHLRGKSRTVPILCGIVPILCQRMMYGEIHIEILGKRS